MSDKMRISLMRRWTRIGALFNTAPTAERVDLESLVLDTTAHARSDERLFVMAASWLAVHHHLLDARRLGRRLTNTDVNAETSAVAGAILSLARSGVTGPTALDAAIRHCRPLRTWAPLFPQLEAHPGLLALVKKEALPLFKAWGFWHNDTTLKLNAIRPAAWIVQHCPELRIRALLGTGLDAEIVELLLDAPRTAADLAAATETTYAAVHAAVSRLLGRGVLVHVRGQVVPLRPIERNDAEPSEPSAGTAGVLAYRMLDSRPSRGSRHQRRCAGRYVARCHRLHRSRVPRLDRLDRWRGGLRFVARSPVAARHSSRSAGVHRLRAARHSTRDLDSRRARCPARKSIGSPRSITSPALAALSCLSHFRVTVNSRQRLNYPHAPAQPSAFHLMRFSTALVLLATLAMLPWGRASVGAQTPSLGEILAGSPAADWRPLDPDYTLYLELPGGRVIFELSPDFSPRHVANVRALARAHYWDGAAIVRVQDDYVAQWGWSDSAVHPHGDAVDAIDRAEYDRAAGSLPFTPLRDPDSYAPFTGFTNGFPAGRDSSGATWMLHCYGAVGVARGSPPDNGSGRELYVVIGQSPRHLDRNVAMIGRVVRGIELLSALPRGAGALGFYATAAERTPITSIRIASELPAAERTPLEALRTESGTFRKVVASRRYRGEEWFVQPTGRINVCNVPLPVRAMTAR